MVAADGDTAFMSNGGTLPLLEGDDEHDNGDSVTVAEAIDIYQGSRTDALCDLDQLKERIARGHGVKLSPVPNLAGYHYGDRVGVPAGRYKCLFGKRPVFARYPPSEGYIMRHTKHYVWVLLSPLSESSALVMKRSENVRRLA